MPLTCRTRDGSRISALDFESGYEIRMKYGKDELLSPFPDCDTLVFPRDAEGRRLHFVHKGKPVTRYNHHPESPLHLYGKALIVETCKKLAEEKGQHGLSFITEFPIGNRIADVAVLLPDGSPFFVVECQLAVITTDELEQRTSDYEREGWDVRWMLGKSANTAANRKWGFEKIGDLWFLDEHESAAA